MAHILNSVMGTTTVETQTQDEQGNVHTAETTAPVVKQVTFMLDKSTPHTLTFLDKGSKVVDGRGVERVKVHAGSGSGRQRSHIILRFVGRRQGRV